MNYEEDYDAKVDKLMDLTERLLCWLDEQGIDYSHIAREYNEEHKRQNA